MRLPLLAAAAASFFTALVHAAPLVQNGETVAFLGDSITQQGAQSPGGYVRLVESGLAISGIKITVIPAGISGNKSNQMLARLDGQVLGKKPAWMTLSCGVNDVWHGANGVPLEDYKKNITEIVDRCEKAGVKVLILTSTQIKLPADSPDNTKLAAYNAFLRELAAARRLPLADLSAAMLAEQAALKAAGVNRALTTDGVHMNIYGNLMMAKGVLQAFGLAPDQLAAVETQWRDLPGTVQPAATVKLTLNEMERLEAYAATRQKPAAVLINEIANAAVQDVLQKNAVR